MYDGDHDGKKKRNKRLLFQATIHYSLSASRFPTKIMTCAHGPVPDVLGGEVGLKSGRVNAQQSGCRVEHVFVANGRRVLFHRFLHHLHRHNSV